MVTRVVAIKIISFFFFVPSLVQPLYSYASDQYVLIEPECPAGESWIKKVFDGCMSAWGDMQICHDNRESGHKKLASMFDGIIGKLVYVDYVFTSSSKEKYRDSRQYDYKMFKGDMLYLNRIIESMIAFYAELPLYCLDAGYGVCLKKVLHSLHGTVQSTVQ